MLISKEPLPPNEVKIHVVVPFYNCINWIERCLNSVKIQTHSNLGVVVMDDASTDGSSLVAAKICENEGWTYHRNEVNHKCPENIWLGVSLTNAEDGDVIFLLDGDDYLPHDGVIARFGEIFAEADTWFTYGQYMSDPPDYRCTPASAPSTETIIDRTYRKVSCFFNHPLVFRKFLFDSIPVDQLKDNSGNWFKAGYDRSIVYPLIELSTPTPSGRDGGETDHWRFINEVSYVYNSINSESEWRLGLEEANVVDQVHYREPLNPLGSTDEQ
jgi:glycosyltransferase involved in cell wall biosynthesis